MYAHAIRGLLELDSDPNRRAKYIDFIDSYAELTDNERMEYEQRFPQESNVMTGIVGRARDEGIQQGILQGQAEGERALLAKQLQRRFGALDPETKQRLYDATTDELERWGENVLEAQTLEEVFPRL